MTAVVYLVRCSIGVLDRKITHFFYKNILYKNIEAETGLILRIY